MTTLGIEEDAASDSEQTSSTFRRGSGDRERSALLASSDSFSGHLLPKALAKRLAAVWLVRACF